MAIRPGFIVRALSLALASAALLVAFTAAAQQPELAAGRNAWRAAALGDYEYGYRKFCECHPDSPPETVVTVRGGKVVGVRHRPVGFDERGAGRAAQSAVLLDRGRLFELVDAALARGATVRASYDAKLGYPDRRSTSTTTRISSATSSTCGSRP